MDEGFLWYGAQRVLAGEVPTRDFQSYDLARYYVLALFFKALGGESILALRLANACLQALALSLALLIVRRARPSGGALFTVFAGFMLFLWMTPSFKIADFVASIALVFGIGQVLEKPANARYFIFGVILGLVGMVGRNHALYGVAAGLLALGHLQWRNTGFHLLPALAWALLGAVAGYSPMLLALLLTPGLAKAIWDGILWMVLESGSTNLSLPVPWPWTVRFSGGSRLGAIVSLFEGGLFMALAIFSLSAFVFLLIGKWKLKQRGGGFLLGALMLSIPYAHYAFSRADLVHLALGAFPALIALLIISVTAGQSLRWKLLGPLVIATVAVMLPQQPAFRAAHSGNWKSAMAGPDELLVSAYTAGVMSLLYDLRKEYPSSRSLWVVPYWPAAYALSGQRSPTWELFGTVPLGAELERAEVERVKAADPGFVLLLDAPWDGREDLRYAVTHPLLYNFIISNYRLRVEPGLPEGVFLYVK